MKRILWIGGGGFIGSTLRYLLGEFIRLQSAGFRFPLATIVINVIGCFAIGLFSRLAETIPALAHPDIRGFVMVGVLGGFTTYSAFGNESYHLAGNGEYITAALNISLHIVLGLGAVFLGRLAAG